MAEQTPNYNLTKPDPSDFYDVNVQNENMDKIDTALKNLSDEIVNIDAPVKSVNNKTGDVVLNAEDVGAPTVQQHNELSQQVSAHSAEKATLAQYGHIQHGTIITTIPQSGWTGNESPYINTVSIPGIFDTDSPFIDVIAEDMAVQEAWGLIYRAVTDTGLITFYATEKPEINIPIQIKVVR